MNEPATNLEAAPGLGEDPAVQVQGSGVSSMAKANGTLHEKWFLVERTVDHLQKLMVIEANEDHPVQAVGLSIALSQVKGYQKHLESVSQNPYEVARCEARNAEVRS